MSAKKLELNSAILENGLKIRVGDVVYGEQSGETLWMRGNAIHGFCMNRHEARGYCYRRLSHKGPCVFGVSYGGFVDDFVDDITHREVSPSVKIASIRIIR